MKTRTFIPVAALFLAAPALASAAPAIAGTAGDWSAWYGCWRAVADEGGPAPLVCVLPGDVATTVRIATIEDGIITEETVVRADGVARPIEEGGCRGSESAFFSSDGRRIFTRAELTCTGLGRVSTGVLAMTSPTEWIDAQALTVNGQHAVRTIRYRTADAEELPAWLATELPQGQQLAQEAARMNAATPLDIDAVVEASRNVSPPAVEALLAAREHGFSLNAQKLVQLREQGVPTSTIDVMVALSYPAKFAVASPVQRGPLADADLARADAAWADDCYDPYWTARRYSSDCRDARYGYGYSRYGYGYGYSPYGYDRYGWNYGNRPIIVVVRGDDGDIEPTGGSLIKGRGYTRNGRASGTATPRGATDRTSEPSSARATPSSSTTTTRSTPSNTSGSSSKPTRTAKPRGNH